MMGTMRTRPTWTDGRFSCWSSSTMSLGLGASKGCRPICHLLPLEVLSARPAKPITKLGSGKLGAVGCGSWRVARYPISKQRCRRHCCEPCRGARPAGLSPPDLLSAA